MTVSPNDFVSVYRNQGDREGCVLAVIGLECLVEYEMPNGSTAMYVASSDDPDVPKRTVSYKTIPMKWRKAILAAGLEWLGRPQQSGESFVRLLPDCRVIGSYMGWGKTRNLITHERVLLGEGVGRRA